jgi:voltage-gated potassium channel
LKRNIKAKIHEIIFEADTPAGKFFDIALLVLILLSVLVVALESIEPLNLFYNKWFVTIEWILTILFTIEYILRIYTVNKPTKYIFSFYGLIDLLTILPAYLSLFIVGAHALTTIRILRLLRIFRILKLTSYTVESITLVDAIIRSKRKIFIFVISMFLITIVFGSIMYVIEGNQDSGFDSIPRGIYWAIVTLTTVGYGDIAPVTPLGQLISAIVMLLGYGIIAIPTGIVTAELAFGEKIKVNTNTQVCGNCHNNDHDNNAIYCKMCGYHLHPFKKENY